VIIAFVWKALLIFAFLLLAYSLASVLVTPMLRFATRQKLNLLAEHQHPVDGAHPLDTGCVALWSRILLSVAFRTIGQSGEDLRSHLQNPSGGAALHRRACRDHRAVSRWAAALPAQQGPV